VVSSQSFLCGLTNLRIGAGASGDGLPINVPFFCYFVEVGCCNYTFGSAMLSNKNYFIGLRPA